jgi:hypothetical protein
MTAAINATMGSAATPPFNVYADKTQVSASYECYGTTGSCPSAANMTTDAVTISTFGGSGAGPTYSWAKVSGDTFTMSASTAATTTFSASVNRNTTKTAVYRCTITRGVDVLTKDVTVTGTYTYAADEGPPIGEEP